MVENVRPAVDVDAIAPESRQMLYTKGGALLAAEHILQSLTREARASAEMKAAEAGRGRYKSCWWIERSALVTPWSVTTCCKATLGHGGSTEIFQASGDNLAKIPPSAIIAAKKEIRLANQAENPLCAGCDDLREAGWQAGDHLQSLALTTTLHCNLACSYCVSYDFSKKGSAFAPLIKTYINNGLLRPGSDIGIGGGEPTIQQDFRAIAHLAFEHGLYMTVYTNATAYSPEVALGLEKGLASVICSVDAGTAATYHRIKGKDFLAKVWGTLTRYAATNSKNVYVKYILMDANRSRHEIDTFIEQAVKAGIRNIVPSANVHNNSGTEGVLPPQLVRAAAYLIAKAEDNGLRIELSEDYVDGFSPKALQAILADVENADTLTPSDQPGTNHPLVPLDIVFFESEMFLLRVLSVVTAKDDFRIILPAPIRIGEQVPVMLGQAVAGAVEKSAYSTASDTEGPLVSAMQEAASRGVAEWSERLKDTATYALELKFDPSGMLLACIEFTRRE